MFKTWTDRQIASRRHVFLRASLTISGSTITQTPRALVAVHRPEEKKNKNSVSLTILHFFLRFCVHNCVFVCTIAFLCAQNMGVFGRSKYIEETKAINKWVAEEV